MKKIVSLLFAGALIYGSSNAQILSEQNVTINMDLQPVLQLEIEGPEVIDFTFTDINQYVRGITRFGANVLKVSASVNFDLWAAGLSQGMTMANGLGWDKIGDYAGGAAIAGGSGATDSVPLSALELRQFPPNPLVADGVCGLVADDRSADYSTAFQAPGAATGNNCIYAPGTAPYLSPDWGATPANDKYIAGGPTTASGCAIPGGSYLNQTFATNGGGGATDFTADGYYFVMDYRILPGLPVRFPFSDANNNANFGGTSLLAIDGLAISYHADQTNPNAYVSPGSYQMNIKYILVEDQ